MLDYREIIKNVCETRSLTYRDLAENCQIHASYFSRVMREKADFSHEQVFLICQYLGFEDDELDYLLTLRDAQTSSQHEHASYCWRKAKALQDKHSKTGKRLKKTEEPDPTHIDEYYKSSWTAIIHMYLSIDRFRLQPETIAKHLNLSPKMVERELSLLKKLKIIYMKNGHLQLSNKRIHLEADSPLSQRNHINWRLQALTSLSETRTKDSDYHMSAVFSATETGKRKIREKYKEFVAEAQKIAEEAGTGEEVYAISFDLFDLLPAED
ncbi:MAG: DUF4423 domain-containing protein [Pseudobacteriovorax sp.]|nr:DUF4423 domain-containing protein [Pseudobacteriovorax sp.]